nr:AhpC/TSA family protein [Saprospiraceae bacterium]
MSEKQYKTAREANGLQVGDTAPDFKASDLYDNAFHLEEALKKGPLVLIFYRGQWCPICNKHLKKLEKRLEDIYSQGASVAAVSPEKSEFLKRTAKKTHASFTLLHDENYTISDKFDVTFKPGKFSRLIYNGILGADLKEAHTDDSQRLPIPATYIINRNKKIVWRHFTPDYKRRSSIDDIIRNIP